MTDSIGVGSCGKAHGIRGEVAVFTSSPELFVPGATVQSARGELTVANARPHKGHLIVAFEELDDRTAAEALRNLELRMSAATVPALEANEYWVADLVGLPAQHLDGSPLGIVAAVVTSDAQDRLVIDTGTEQVEVPFVSELVPEVTKTHVVVNPPPGLLD